MNVSKLSDVELNRAMIWLYMSRIDSFLDQNFKLGLEELSESDSINDDGFGLTIELNNWQWSVEFLRGYLAYDLTMPLAVENNLNIDFINEGIFQSTDCTFDLNIASQHPVPLRAICEVLVMIALERKS